MTVNDTLKHLIGEHKLNDLREKYLLLRNSGQVYQAETDNSYNKEFVYAYGLFQLHIVKSLNNSNIETLELESFRLMNKMFFLTFAHLYRRLDEITEPYHEKSVGALTNDELVINKIRSISEIKNIKLDLRKNIRLYKKKDKKITYEELNDAWLDHNESLNLTITRLKKLTSELENGIKIGIAKSEKNEASKIAKKQYYTGTVIAILGTLATVAALKPVFPELFLVPAIDNKTNAPNSAAKPQSKGLTEPKKLRQDTEPIKPVEKTDSIDN